MQNSVCLFTFPCSQVSSLLQGQVEEMLLKGPLCRFGDEIPTERLNIYNIKEGPPNINKVLNCVVMEVRFFIQS